MFTASGALYVAQRIEECLMSGFTTVRDAGMTDWSFKHAVERGLMAGPRMFVSNAFISQTGGHGDLRLRHDRSPSGVNTWAITYFLAALASYTAAASSSTVN